MNIYGALAELKYKRMRWNTDSKLSGCELEMPLLWILHYPIIINVCPAKSQSAMGYGRNYAKNKQTKNQLGSGSFNIAPFNFGEI